MPAHTTIITPIKAPAVESCRQYLRDNVEPSYGPAGLQCSPKFPFSRIPTLHFCSFIVLDQEDDFGPALVFEATFDGSREDFLSDLLRVAPAGMQELYRHCAGYPGAEAAIPEITREYLIGHDEGAHVFFCGSPGRSVAQIKDEQSIHAGIVEFLPSLRARGEIPARLKGFFDAVRRDFIRGTAANRWAAQPAPVPWEIRFRSAIASAALIATLAAACAFGAALAASVGLSPLSLRDLIVDLLGQLSQFAGNLAASFVSKDPLSAGLVDVLQPALLLFALSGIWLFIRVLELFLGSWSKHPRDQFFILRFPLHVAVILTYALPVFLLGAVALALISELQSARIPISLSVLLASGGTLLGIVLALLVLQHWATTLELSVQINKLDARREKWRRLLLDLARFAMAICFAVGALIVTRHLPMVLGEKFADIAREWVYGVMVIAAYGLIGILAAYGIGLMLFLLLRAIELTDKRKFDNPSMLLARAGFNARKYAREEGGNNRLQNHLASITLVKPGLVRSWLLRSTLFVINLLSRFWFNRGDLGGIPTILSARWVLIDGGRRLLFLDNYGGAWDSYLNEFIDMGAVKGLNAIWCNTFVKAAERCYGFPATRFFFWLGAQAEQPFKAYVRQSQVETIAWYSAYPTLSVVNINTTTELRQSLCRPLVAAQIDAIFQNL